MPFLKCYKVYQKQQDSYLKYVIIRLLRFLNGLLQTKSEKRYIQPEYQNNYKMKTLIMLLNKKDEKAMKQY